MTITDYELKKKLILNLGNETLVFTTQCDIEMDGGVKQVYNIWIKSENDSSFIDEEEFFYHRIKNMIIKTISDDL
jgi:hypothetical protein